MSVAEADLSWSCRKRFEAGMFETDLSVGGIEVETEGTEGILAGKEDSPCLVEDLEAECSGVVAGRKGGEAGGTGGSLTDRNFLLFGH